MTPSTISNTLKKTKLFFGIDDNILDDFIKNASIKTYPKGTVLFLHTDKADYFYIIISGWLKLYRETLDGHEAIIDILNDNHIFGETSLFNNMVYSETAETIEDTEIIKIPINILNKDITNNPQIALKMLHLMSHFRKQQDTELEHRNTQNAPQRIGCFLLRLCKPDVTDSVVLYLPYDKNLVASRLGMQPETFSRALNKLKEKTDITINGATITIHSVEKIIHFSCSACSSNFPCQDLS
jgi:CRP/FNR family transcriptional regulator, dissimilatory nitrate respiration regulator